jgi:hypothetical protein
MKKLFSILICLSMVSPDLYAAKSIVTCGGGASALSAGLNSFFSLIGYSISGSDSSNTKVTMETAGTFSNFGVMCTENSFNNSLIATFRKNGADGSESVTFNAGVTGTVFDTSNTDSISATDVVNVKVSNTAGSGAATLRMFNAVFDTGNGNTLNKFVNIDPIGTNNFTANATVNYIALNGYLGSFGGTTEATSQYKMRSAGTLKNMSVNIKSNSRATSTAFKSRKNAADGNLLVTIGAGVTGLVEDTSNSDSIVSTDLVDISILGGAESTSLVVNWVSTEFITTTSKFHMIVTINSGSMSTGNYFMMPGAGMSSSQLTSEANAIMTTKLAFTASNLFAYISGNTGSAAGTIELRKNSASATNTIAVTAGLTGLVEDTTHTDSFAVGDTIDIHCNTASGVFYSTSIMGILATTSASAATFIQPFFFQPYP